MEIREELIWMRGEGGGGTGRCEVRGNCGQEVMYGRTKVKKKVK